MIIITGPTSSGKTSLAVKLAKKFNAEIISADSRQIYKYMDVGTGKLPVNEREADIEKHDNYWLINGIKIWMYDVLTPNKFFSAYDFKIKSQEIIKDIKSRGKIPLIVGGTGFYIDALVNKFEEINPPSDQSLETRRMELEKFSIQELQKMIPVKVLDQMNESDKNNPRRLSRRIELIELGVKNFADTRVDPSEENLVIELTADKNYLYERVDKWADLIWKPLLIEINNLIDLGYKYAGPMKGLVYKNGLECIENPEISNQSIQKMKYDLHSYIRRQQTWFKRYKKSQKVDITLNNFDTKVSTLVESYITDNKT